MAAERVRGTEGYGEAAAALASAYESLRFEDLHEHLLPLIPAAPAPVLDIGAGTGRDAAAFAERGHAVVAVEPEPALRIRAAALHPSPLIDWRDDSLPDLATLAGDGAGDGEGFAVVMLTAVWMHLDAVSRRRAMPVVAGLLRPGGIMALTLRHGPVPPGRRMYEVSGDETVALAEAAGLRLVLRLDDQPSAFARTDVRWTKLVFGKG